MAEAGPLSKLRLALNVQNLFDLDPPLLPEPWLTRGVGYDPVNASGRGRTLGLVNGTSPALLLGASLAAGLMIGIERGWRPGAMPPGQGWPECAPMR